MDDTTLTANRLRSDGVSWLSLGFISLLTILCLVSGMMSPAQAQTDEADLIERVNKLYEDGNLREAELTALRALQESKTLAPVDRAQLHRLLGFTYVAQGENEKAKQQFIAWLELDPLAQLDPLYISPKIISVFSEAKAGFSQRKTPPPDYANLNAQVQAVRRSLLFPGLGQLHRGEQIKGFSLIVSQVVLLGTFTYCQINYDRARDRYLGATDPIQMQGLYDDYNLYYRGRNATLLLAAGVYLYSLFDIIYINPHVPLAHPSLALIANPTPPSQIGIKLSLTLH